jgi:basic amino acid/polyamine antiporter, APA family
MSFARFLVKKPIAAIQAESNNSELKRTLGAGNLTSLGVGAIIGAGIFVMTGQAAANYAGPAILFSFVLAGLCCAFAALCYAELASTLPVSGSAYSYSYASLGEVFAWIMGWLLVLEYGIAASTVAVGWSGYLVSFLKDFGVVIPEGMSKATMQFVTLETGKELVNSGMFNLPAFLGMLACSVLLVFGVKESASVNNVIVAIKVFVILLFIAFGLAHINPENLTPFVPENQGGDKYGYPGILRAAGVIFFAYVGFEAVSTAAQEAKNPQRDIPIGIIASLVICTVLYMLVALALVGIVPYQSLNVPDPIAVGVDAIGLPWLAFLVKVGAIAGLSSVMLVLLYAQTRIFYTMSRDGLLPAIFSKVHTKYHTPWLNTLIVGFVVALVAGMTPIDVLGDLVSLGTLMAFSIICFSVIYLRVKEPTLQRPFKVPSVPGFGSYGWLVIPILGIACCGYLMWGLREMFLTLKFYFLIGLVIYFVYGQKHSKLRVNK